MVHIAFFQIIIDHIIDQLSVSWRSQGYRIEDLCISSSKQSHAMNLIKHTNLCIQSTNLIEFPSVNSYLLIDNQLTEVLSY